MIFYFAHHSIFEDFYIAIISNKNLTDLEKEDIMIDLYDKIRMLKVNCEGDYSPTHISFMKKSKFKLKKVEYPHYLYAEPITLMLLKVIELEDWNRLRLFLNMNLDSTIMSYIKMACLSSVLEAFNRGKPVTRIDLVINDNQIKDVIQVLQLKKIKVDIQQLCLLYSNFINFYLRAFERKNSRKYVYPFHPRLSFNREIIDTVFNYLAKLNNLEKEFQYISLGDDAVLLSNINKLLEENI